MVNTNEVVNKLTFFVSPKRKLTPKETIFGLYLIDWKHSITFGETVTDNEWFFDNTGVHCVEKYAPKSALTGEHEQTIKHVAGLFNHNDYLGVIKLVYATYPSLMERNQNLNLPVLARKRNSNKK